MSRRGAEAHGIDVFERFEPLPGSGYIASGYALGVVGALVERRRPAAVLEIGSGIGTITTAVLEASDRAGSPVRRHVAVEDVPFCLEQFAVNLGPRAAEVVLVERAADLTAELGPFDLVIVDGGHTGDLAPELQRTFGPDAVEAEVAAWAALVAPGALVVFENERADQQAAFRRHVGRPWAYRRQRPLDGTPGVHRYQLDPSVVDRARAASARAFDAAWHARALPLVRQLHHRCFGRPLGVRTAVARGEW